MHLRSASSRPWASPARKICFVAHHGPVLRRGAGGSSGAHLGHLATRLIFATGADLSKEIYRRTLYQRYAVHLSRNISEAIDGISGKINTVITSVINPLLVIASNGLMLSVILAALLLYRPLIALVSFGGFGLIYAAIFLTSRARLRANSVEVAVKTVKTVKTLCHRHVGDVCAPDLEAGRNRSYAPGSVSSLVAFGTQQLYPWVALRG